jgi:hypothetical protein
MIEVHDDRRVLEFEGSEIGFSSSERPGVGRWIEFTLYKTAGDGQYVLSRVGVSNVYHAPECYVATRGGIIPEPVSVLEADAEPCEKCRPQERELPLVARERDKTWARVCKTPEALYSALLKPDPQDGSLRMTAVARRLLEDASRTDAELAALRQVETIT